MKGYVQFIVIYLALMERFTALRTLCPLEKKEKVSFGKASDIKLKLDRRGDYLNIKFLSSESVIDHQVWYFPQIAIELLDAVTSSLFPYDFELLRSERFFQVGIYPKQITKCKIKTNSLWNTIFFSIGNLTFELTVSRKMRMSIVEMVKNGCSDYQRLEEEASNYREEEYAFIKQIPILKNMNLENKTNALLTFDYLGKRLAFERRFGEAIAKWKNDLSDMFFKVYKFAKLNNFFNKVSGFLIVNSSSNDRTLERKAREYIDSIYSFVEMYLKYPEDYMEILYYGNPEALFKRCEKKPGKFPIY